MTQQKQKNVREREVMKYRLRQDRIFGLYLAIKAWHNSLDCVVLSRKDLLQFFDMETTPTDRMEQFREHIEPWFRGYKPYYRENDKIYVNFLFLVRGKDVSHLPSSPNLSDIKVVRKLINNTDPNLPKTALFGDLADDHKVPTHGKMVAELSKLITGLTAPEIKDQAEATKSNVANV